ncbi:MAG: hypothetical protein K0S05_3420 [Agromyces sp.]|nr:hypothetical protein [Agromyces sp.]
MAVVETRPESRVRQPAQHPRGVRSGHDPVALALHEQHGRGDLLELEAPRRREGDIVVDEAVGPEGIRPTDVGAQRGPLPLERGVVGGEELLGVELLRLGEASAARSASGERMPANQSNSSVYGAIPAIETTAVTRSGSSAAPANACGAPPDAPMAANRSTPNASATAATSAADDATSRPGRGEEPP